MYKMAEVPELETPPIEPRDLTQLLDQMSFMAQCNELYDKFMKSRIPNEPFKHYQRHNYIKEIIMYYNILEEYFMIESAKKVQFYLKPNSNNYFKALKLDQKEEA